MSDLYRIRGNPDFIIGVSGMMCQKNCARTVHAALVDVVNVNFATVSFDDSEALVWGPDADPGELTSAIEDVGFECQLKESHGIAQSFVIFDNSKQKINLPAHVSTTKSSTSTLAADQFFECTVGGMSCAACVRNIEEHLIRSKGVCTVRIALLTARLEITFNSSLVTPDELILSVQGLGYSVENQNCKCIGDVALRKVSLALESILNTSQTDEILQTIQSAPGVAYCSIQSQRLTIHVNEQITNAVGVRDLCDQITSLGFKCSYEKELDRNRRFSQNSDIDVWFRLMCVALFFGIPVLLIHFSMINSPSLMKTMDSPSACNGAITWNEVIMLCLNAPLQFGVGAKFYRSAVLGATHGNFGMDCLIVVGTSITFGYSLSSIILSCASGKIARHTFFEASGMLIMFVTLGKYLEAYAKGSTISAISSLLDLQPAEAILVSSPLRSAPSSSYGSLDESRSGLGRTDNSREVLQTIDVELIQRGDVLKVLPGCRIATDGTVTHGASFVDESMITGESHPVKKSVGDFVFGATINGNGVLYVKVKSVGHESALAQIINLVESAQMNKAPIQDYADRIASIFTPLVLLLAMITFLSWLMAAWLGFVPTSWFEEEYGDPVLFSMLFAISVVVISCPCALGLATPTALMVGTTIGAQNGILIKGGGVFESAQKVNALVFDKTGTLTFGKPVVTDIVPVSESRWTSSPDPDLKLSEEDLLLQIAFSVEQHSEHPLSRAIANALEERRIRGKYEVRNFQNLVGRGVEGLTELGMVRVGNRRLLSDCSIALDPSIESKICLLENQGKTVICVAVDSSLYGIIGIMDTIKPEAKSTVAKLRSMEIDVWMVTGDHYTTAEAIARQLEIPHNRIVAGALPAGKVAKIEEMQHNGFCVAMVGDGINDSPALAKADLGIALGAGSHIAIEAASVLLVRSNLWDVVTALDLAKHVFFRIQLNLFWAVLYNIIAIPFAAGVWFPWTHTLVPPQYAGFSMALSSVSVVLSSIQLRYYRRPVMDDEEEHYNSDTLVGGFCRWLTKGHDGRGEYSKVASEVKDIELI